MSESCFVDTNVLIYARDESEHEKKLLAGEWLKFLWASHAGRVSMQVLMEFYVAVTQKLAPGLKPEIARRDIRDLTEWEPIVPTLIVFEQAWSIQDRFKFSWWDSLIISAAQQADCRYLITEDLQEGQIVDSVEIVNPFKHSPGEVFA